MFLRDNPACLKPWENIIVYADGKVKFCCFISSELGNLNHQEFSEIWNGPTARRIRRQFLEQQIPSECCNCPLLHNYNFAAGSEK